MKKYLSIFLLFLWSNLLIGQNKKPVTIQSKAIIYHEQGWYKTQATLWREEVSKNPANQEAWLNLFMATKRSTNNNWGITNTENEVGKLVNEIKRVHPNSFVYHFAQSSYYGAWNPDALKHIKKAYEISPNKVMGYSNYVPNFEVYNLPKERAEINKKWFDSGEYSNGLLNYHYNILKSLEPNAVIFTGGDNDTFPLWMLQDVKKLRQDVTVINTHLSGIFSYQEILYKNMEIELTNTERQELKTLSEGTQAPANRQKRLIKMIQTIDKKSNRPIYLGLTLGGDFVKSLEDSLYLTGLVNRYSTKKIDNIATLKKNFLTTYHLDYVEFENYIETRPQPVKRINQLYIPGLMTLYKHSKNSGDYDNVKFCEKYIRILAEHSKNKTDILKEISN